MPSSFPSQSRRLCSRAAELRQLEPDPGQQRDLLMTIEYYDTVRRYQQHLDPGAYFRSAWLPDVTVAQRRGVVADFLRHPRAPANVTLEVMLVAAHDSLRAGDYERAEQLLGAINAVLAANLHFAEPLAARYRAVVAAVTTAGYEVQRVWLDADGATALVYLPDRSRQYLDLSRTPAGWLILDRT